MKRVLFIPYIHIIALSSLMLFSSMTLAEKKAQLLNTPCSMTQDHAFRALQQELVSDKQELASLYHQLNTLCPWDGSLLTTEAHEQVQHIRHKIIQIKKHITDIETRWKEESQEEFAEDFEGLWHQPSSTIGQLIIDYNPGDIVYVMPPDIANLKVHVSSRISIPRAEWQQMLEVILASFGIGIRHITPFVHQLYILRLNHAGLHMITEDISALKDIDANEKIAFVCSPPTGDLQRIFQFLEKFAPQEQVSIQVIGGHLVIIGLVREVQDLMKVYHFVASPQRAQEYRIVALQRADSEEMAKILTSIFEGEVQKSTPPSSRDKGAMFFPIEASFGFRVIALKYPSASLFFLGKQEQIEKACRIIHDVESSIGEVQEKTIQLYNCQHSEAAELAKVLSQVYHKLINNPTAATSSTNGLDKKSQPRPSSIENVRSKIEAREHAQDALIIDTSSISIGTPHHAQNGSAENFIVDPKTNSIIIVAEAYILPKLKELISKLDVPKRMVQIDVLLFEKRITDSSSIGLQNLKMKGDATKVHKEGLSWSYDRNASNASSNTTNGLLTYVFSQPKRHGFPAYDLAYQFLLSQDNIQISATPSVVTVNQTQAKIAVVEQMSINTGAVSINDKGDIKDSFSRAEYGITIQITPTIHAKMNAEDPKYITLLTDIIFDTPQRTASHYDRPDVARRNVKNEVCIQDNETAVIGGLRRKTSTGSQYMIPFLGELPGIGKLFSASALADESTEMFIFLTPKILPDSREERRQIRLTELSRRPGDIPEFLQEIEQAKEHSRVRCMQKSFALLFSSPTLSS